MLSQQFANSHVWRRRHASPCPLFCICAVIHVLSHTRTAIYVHPNDLVVASAMALRMIVRHVAGLLIMTGFEGHAGHIALLPSLESYHRELGHSNSPVQSILFDVELPPLDISLLPLDVSLLLLDVSLLLLDVSLLP